MADKKKDQKDEKWIQFLILMNKNEKKNLKTIFTLNILCMHVLYFQLFSHVVHIEDRQYLQVLKLQMKNVEIYVILLNAKTFFFHF